MVVRYRIPRVCEDGFSLHLKKRKEIAMKRFASFIAAALAMLMAVNIASAAPMFSERDLDALNTEHVRIIRQAQRVCAAGFHRGFVRLNDRHPCVIGEVERHVRSTDRPALLRFHRHLPLQHRFDAHRDMNNVRRFFN